MQKALPCSQSGHPPGKVAAPPPQNVANSCELTATTKSMAKGFMAQGSGRVFYPFRGLRAGGLPAQGSQIRAGFEI